MEKLVTEILKTIDDSINSFQGKIPGLQKLLFDELQPLVKQFQIKNGSLLNNIDNLKLLLAIKNKLQKIVTNKDYKQAIQDFIDSYDSISNLNMLYFAGFNKKFTPAKTLPIIKQLAIESTITDLIGQGMSDGLVRPVKDILNKNITTGGSYADMQNQLSDFINGNKENLGHLEKYTGQITTDAINQFHAQYHATIAQDLQFNWGRYVGSLIKTSRQFCILLTAKEWVHKTELPEVIKGHIDGEYCKLSKTTGLPLGMIPDTNESNFVINRGGYFCGHHYFMVPDSSVPQSVKSKFANPEPEINIKPKDDLTQVAKDTLTNNKTDIDKIKAQGFTVYPDLFNSLTKTLSIQKTNNQSSYYLPSKNIVRIGHRFKAFGDDSEYYKNTLVAHETGHAIHNQKDIINNSTKTVSKDFESHYNNLKSIIKGRQPEIYTLLKDKFNKATGNDRQQLLTMMDILGSLTKGVYGFGHSKAYYKTASFSEAEIFAHSVSLLKVKNDFEAVHPSLEKVVEEMRKEILNWL